jgi:hypothetical protein
MHDSQFEFYKNLGGANDDDDDDDDDDDGLDY